MSDFQNYVFMVDGQIVGVANTNIDQTKLGWVLLSDVPDATLLVYYQQTLGQILEESCKNEILAGFNSSALGAAYTYPADDNSQRNLISAAVASLTAGSSWQRTFWCADSQNVWAMRAHSAAQIQQVNADFNSFVAAAQSKLVQLNKALMAATDSATAAAICW